MRSESTLGRVGFFDLPREIRDVIYGYAVLDINNAPNHQDHHLHSCTKASVFLARPTPPYFGSECHCPVPGAWLATVSAVCRQFAVEIRPVFWSEWLIRVSEPLPKGWMDYLVKDSPRPKIQPGLPETGKFLQFLGTEAKDLRRLYLQVPFMYLLYRGAMADVLNGIKTFVHDDLNILIEVCDERESAGWFACHFEGSGEEKQAKVHKLSYGGKEWEGWRPGQKLLTTFAEKRKKSKAQAKL